MARFVRSASADAATEQSRVALEVALQCATAVLAEGSADAAMCLAYTDALASALPLASTALLLRLVLPCLASLLLLADGSVRVQALRGAGALLRRVCSDRAACSDGPHCLRRLFLGVRGAVTEPASGLVLQVAAEELGSLLSSALLVGAEDGVKGIAMHAFAALVDRGGASVTAALLHGLPALARALGQGSTRAEFQTHLLRLLSLDDCFCQHLSLCALPAAWRELDRTFDGALLGHAAAALAQTDDLLLVRALQCLLELLSLRRLAPSYFQCAREDLAFLLVHPSHAVRSTATDVAALLLAEEPRGTQGVCPIREHFPAAFEELSGDAAAWRARLLAAELAPIPKSDFDEMVLSLALPAPHCGALRVALDEEYFSQSGAAAEESWVPGQAHPLLRAFAARAGARRLRKAGGDGDEASPVCGYLRA